MFQKSLWKFPKKKIPGNIFQGNLKVISNKITDELLQKSPKKILINFYDNYWKYNQLNSWIKSSFINCWCETLHTLFNEFR